MQEKDIFGQENLMIELGQMPSEMILNNLYENNVQCELEQIQKEAQGIIDQFQVWSWA
jgi:hypothetical protein